MAKDSMHKGAMEKSAPMGKTDAMDKGAMSRSDAPKR
jgi:hypothetical protein